MCLLVIIGTFNKEKALVGAFSMIVKLQTSRRFVSSSILDIGDGVEAPPRPQDEGVLGQQRLVDDPPLVLGLLEMRIREQEEHFRELPLPEEIGQIFHGVTPETGDVSELSWILRSER